MRSEKDQMTVGKDKSVVEIQFRDVPREQENTSGNIKQKEEKKEVFTKVGIQTFAKWRIVYADSRHGGGGIISALRTATGGGYTGFDIIKTSSLTFKLHLSLSVCIR